MKDMSMRKKAKMDLLQELRKVALDMIHSGSSEHDMSSEEPMQKVMVAAKDKQGLQKGLDKAKDVLSSMPEMEHDEDEESPEHEAMETPEEESAEHADESDEGDESESDLLAKMAQIKAKLAKMKKA